MQRQFAPEPNLALSYFSKTGRLPHIERIDDIATAGLKEQLQRADFILTIVPASDGTGSTDPVYGLEVRNPISHELLRADASASATDHFDLIGTYPVRGGEIHLYGRKPD